MGMLEELPAKESLSWRWKALKFVIDEDIVKIIG